MLQLIMKLANDEDEFIIIIDGSLCTKHCPKCFTCIMPLDPYNNPLE